jgi:antitoxin MazE
MKARLVQIGNSRGIRLSKLLLEHAALSEDVEVIAEPGLISIRSAQAPRAGWAEAASRLHGESREDTVIPTDFDDAEWKW